MCQTFKYLCGINAQVVALFQRKGSPSMRCHKMKVKKDRFENNLRKSLFYRNDCECVEQPSSDNENWIRIQKSMGQIWRISEGEKGLAEQQFLGMGRLDFICCLFLFSLWWLNITHMYLFVQGPKIWLLQWSCPLGVLQVRNPFCSTGCVVKDPFLSKQLKENHATICNKQKCETGEGSFRNAQNQTGSWRVLKDILGLHLSSWLHFAYDYQRKSTYWIQTV